MDNPTNTAPVTITRLENGVAQIDSTMAAVHDIYINGSYKGNVTTAATLIIDKDAMFEGVAIACNCEIRGRFKGTLQVKNTLSLYAGGVCVGDVKYGMFVSEKGSVITGKIDKIKAGLFENLLKEDKAYQAIFKK